MSKCIDEPIKVHQNNDVGTITAFIWRKRLYRVLEILGWWREPREWWNGESVQLFVRLNAQHSSIGTYELSKLENDWFMHRVLD